MARDPQTRNIQGYQPTGKLDASKPPTGGSVVTKRTPSISANGKIYPMPEYGEVILTFHDGQLRYIERRTKEKVE